MKKILILLIIMAIPAVVFAQIEWARQDIDIDFNGAQSIYAIDVDGDSNIDILGAARNVNDITWWENDGSSTPEFTEHIIAPNFSGASSAYAIDLDDDNDIDILGQCLYGNQLAWWQNDGNENFTKHTIDNNGGGYSIFSIDLDSDSDKDVVATIGNGIAWWQNDGSENFTKYIITDDFQGSHSVYAIDVDGDDDKDVLGAAEGADEITWWENDGSSLPNFTAHVIDSTFVEARSVYAIDLDNDNDIDVLGAAADEITWWENDGNNPPNFTLHVIDTTFARAQSVYAEDLDKDGDVDILGGARTHPLTWWENDGNTSPNFTKHIIDEYFSIARSIYATDLDGDTDIDVMAAAGDMRIVWWRNSLITMHNVGPISIDIPSTVPLDTTIFPHATVKNFGQNTETFNVTCAIEPGEYNSTTVCHLVPGESVLVTFPESFTFPEGGSYTMNVITKLQDDEFPGNDTLEKIIEIPVVLDVGPISIDIPEILPIDTTLYPHATVKNFGSNTENISVTCRINPGIYNRIEYINLAPGEIFQVTFDDPFTFELDTTYQVVVFTRLDGDEYPENDTLEKTIETQGEGVAEGNLNIPTSFSFSLKNNPAKNKTVFNLALPEPALITLKIYDISGRLIDRVITDRKSAGYYEIPWTPKTTAGVYFYTLDSPWQTKVGKLVIVR